MKVSVRILCAAVVALAINVRAEINPSKFKRLAREVQTVKKLEDEASKLSSGGKREQRQARKLEKKVAKANEKLQRVLKYEVAKLEKEIKKLEKKREKIVNGGKSTEDIDKEIKALTTEIAAFEGVAAGKTVKDAIKDAESNPGKEIKDGLDPSDLGREDDDNKPEGKNGSKRPGKK